MRASTAFRAIAARMRAGVDRARLSRLARGLIDARRTYLPPRKLLRLEHAIESVADVVGDFVEFGVALGGTGILLARHAGPDRRFLGFDVFGLIPAPASAKDDDRSRDRYRVIASGGADGLSGEVYYGYRDDLFDDVRDAFAQWRVPVDGTRVVLRRGLFEITVPDAPLGAIALAHVDCDWYDPVRFCLAAVADRIVPGGLIVIDDYHDYGGCRAAVDEFRRADLRFAFEPGINPCLRRLAGC